MSERQETPPPSGSGSGDDATLVQPAVDAGRRDATTPATTPGIPAAGAPATGATAGSTAGSATAPDHSSRPVPVRRPDALAGLLLVLAGVAAAISLLLRWLADRDVTGYDLVRRGFDDAEQGFGEVIRSGFWQPLTIVFGGGALLLLGLLMFVRGRSHRFLGLLALLVALLVTAAVLVPLVRAGFEMSRFDLGIWFAVAVAGLGLLGALKALLTRPKLGAPPRRA